MQMQLFIGISAAFFLILMSCMNFGFVKRIRLHCLNEPIIKLDQQTSRFLQTLYDDNLFCISFVAVSCDVDCCSRLQIVLLTHSLNFILWS